MRKPALLLITRKDGFIHTPWQAVIGVVLRIPWKGDFKYPYWKWGRDA